MVAPTVRPRYLLARWHLPDDEASAQDVEEIESVMDEYGLEHVLYDVGEPNNLAESIAAETDAEVLPISPVETQLPEYHEQDWGTSSTIVT